MHEAEDVASRGLERDAAPTPGAASEQARAFPETGFHFAAGDVSGGPDLILSGPDERSNTSHEEREGEKLAALGGAALTGGASEARADSASPQHYAQTSNSPSTQTPIGRVEKVAGNATVTRNGALVELHQGDPLFKGDTVQTASGASLTIKLIDGTVFGLSASARMILDEMTYSATSTANSAFFELVQGIIGFVAGKAAETGDFRVETPVATMGIRGTAVRVEISATDGATRFSLLSEPSGRAGSFTLFDKSNPSRVIGTVSDPNVATVITVSGLAQINATQVIKTPEELRLESLFVQDLFQAVGQEPTQRRGSGDFEGLSPIPVLDLLPSPDGSDFFAPTIPVRSELIHAQIETPAREITSSASAMEDGPQVALRGSNGGAGLRGADRLPAGVSFDAATGQFTLDPTHPAYQSLGAGETITVSVAFDIEDRGQRVPVRVSWTVTGENDAPVVSVVDPGAGAEKDTPEKVAFNLFTDLTRASDVDHTDRPAFAAASAVVAAAAGSDTTDTTLISVDQVTGEVSYDRAAFNFLGVGQSAIYAIAFDVVSGSDRVHKVVTLTMAGENDAPVVTVVDPGADAEKDTPEKVSFNLFTDLTQAHDADRTDAPAFAPATTVISAAARSTTSDTTLISINEATGEVSYDRAAFNFLGVGQSAIYAIGFDVISGSDRVHRTVTLTISGENDAPVLTVIDPGVDSEKDTSERVSFNLFTDLTRASDVDHTDAPAFAADSVVISAAAGSGATDTSLISIDQATGEVSYDRAAFNFLGTGESAIYTIGFDVVSGPDRVHKVVTLTISGENDAPVASPDIFHGIHETAQTALPVQANDLDADSDSLTITHFTPPIEGSLFLDDSGALVFDPGDDFEALSAGQTATISFDYTISDGKGGTDTATATVQIAGEGQFTSQLQSAGETKTFPFNGQLVSIALEAPSRTATSSADVGLDITFGAQRPMNILYVVDISGSTRDEFEGTPTGDLNGDGDSNTILDAEIDGLIRLTEQVRSLGFSPADVSVTVIPFDASADPASTNVAAASFLLGTSGDETIANFLKSLRNGGGTNFENALQAAVENLHLLDPDGNENNIVYFLSDGSGTGSFTDEVETLESVFDTQIAAVGIGEDARLDLLDRIDNTGKTDLVTSTDELNAALVGTFLPGEVVDLQILVNGQAMPDVGPEDLIQTADGFALDISAMGLAVHAGEINQVLASVTFTDGVTLTAELPVIGALPLSTDL